MEKVRSIVRRYTGRTSIFERVFTGLILLSLLMVLFLGFWMNHISSSNYRHQVALSHLSRLKQTDDAMELLVGTLGQSMTQMMWSNDFITQMISPRRTTQDQAYRILRQLNSIVSGSELVQSAFLYSPASGEIFDSTSMMPAGEFKDWPILSEHFKQPFRVQNRSSAMTTTTVMNYGGRLLVIEDLNIASYIGTLVYELNAQELCDTLGLQGMTAESDILIYDKNRVGGLENLLPFETVIPEWENEKTFIDSENAEARAGGQTHGYYRYDAPESDRIYLMPMDTGILSVKYRDMLPMYILAAAVFLIISIGFDFYISSAIYRPINRLMKLVTQADGRQKTSGDAELDFLENAYSDAMDGQSQLRGLVAGIAPDILDAMLKNLMVGKVLEEQRVAEILEGVGNPIEVHGRFLVLLCQLNEPKGRAVTDAELNLHLLSIRNLVAGIETPDYRLYDIHTEKMIVAIVMGFSSDYPVVTIKMEYARISRLLQKLGEQIPYRLQVERGSIYQNIMDIRYAYQEVADKLQYRQYLESSEGRETADDDSDTNRVVNRRYLRERAKSLAEQAARGNKEELEALICQILEDLERDEPELTDFRSMTELFLDDLTEKVIALPLSREDQELLESAHGAAGIAQPESREELALRVAEYARTAAELLYTYNRKNSFKYVQRAREYIAQNYADSDLSLNDVCEHIGISASYLSELFTEINGEKFSACLAALRVEKAGRLLRTTKVTIKEIGFCCGFNSIQNFIRVFKKYMDRTPGQYREEQS